MRRQVKSKEREFYRPTRPPFVTQYERDLRAIESADRFRKAAIFFLTLGGLGLVVLIFWLWVW